jgi:hypothetical protein
MNNNFEPPSPQSIQKISPAIKEVSNSNDDSNQLTRQRSASTHSAYHLTASSDSTDFTSKNTNSSLENITKPSTVDSFVSRPISASSSELPIAIGSDVTQNRKNKYTNNPDKPPEPLQNLSSEQKQQQQQQQQQSSSMSDSTSSLLNAEIQAQLQKLALREDLDDLRRVIDMLKQQSIRDREEYLDRVKEQKKVEKEIFDQISITNQRLDKLTFEQSQVLNKPVEESSQIRTGKMREDTSEPASTRRSRRSQPSSEQEDTKYFYESSRAKYDLPDYPLPRSFMHEVDDFRHPFYMDDYMYDFDPSGHRYPPPPPPPLTRKGRPRSKSADYQRMNPNPFDGPYSTRQNGSRKSSVRSSRSNRSKEIHKEDLEENGYHSAAEEEDDVPQPSSRSEYASGSGNTGSVNEGRLHEEQQQQREVPVSRHSSRGSTGRFRKRPSNSSTNNMASSIPPHLMYHNPGFRPPPHPHYLPHMNLNRVNERERHGSMPYNMTPGNEYPPQYVPQGMSPRHMGFSEGPRPPLQSMGWPPNTNQNMYGIPPHRHPHHHPPPPGGASAMTEPMGANSTGSHPIPNYETGQDSVSQQPPGMRRYPVQPQQHGYQPLYPESGQMVFM